MDEAYKPAKLSDIARERFRRALLEGRIKPGSFHSQADLVKSLDVPVGALRDAMQVLESEGLLTIMPRSGIQIVRADLELLRNTFQLRKIIELEATRKFAERASDGELAEWRQRHEAIAHTNRTEGADPALTAVAIALDGSFHDHLVASMRNPLLDVSYARTMTLLNVIRVDALYALPRYNLATSMQEHIDILDAMLARNAEEAARRMEVHLSGSMQRAMGL